MPEPSDATGLDSFTRSMPLFEAYEHQWVDWSLEERIGAAYGIAGSNCERARRKIRSAQRRRRPQEYQNDLALVVVTCESIMSALGKVLLRTPDEMRALSVDVWKRRLAPGASK